MTTTIRLRGTRKKFMIVARAAEHAIKNKYYCVAIKYTTNSVDLESAYVCINKTS